MDTTEQNMLEIERDILEENLLIAKREWHKASKKAQFLLNLIVEKGIVLTPDERDKMSKIA